MWAQEALGVLDGHGTGEPPEEYRGQELGHRETKGELGWEGAGRTATSVPAPPARFPLVLHSHPRLWV